MAKRMTGLSVRVGRIRMKNPVMVSSGTFGYGRELEDVADIRRLGAIVVKTVTRYPRSGNDPPRIAETPSGVLNSIGLENDGLDLFIKEKMPYLRRIGVPVIVSIGGERMRDFSYLAGRLDGIDGISGIEVNISCPNLDKKGHGLFSQDRRLAYKAVRGVRKATSLTVITKLTPNVTDIRDIAAAVEDAGSDAVSLVNTYAGMAVDMRSKMSRLGSVSGGLSGPAIKPLAIKAVWDVYGSVDIPVVGMGGIMTAEDALEFIICGATAVSLGTVNLVWSDRCGKIVDGIRRYMRSERVKNISELTGSLRSKR
jgi:dihydroorotate dehydrogenase (NAD+) catalytic subunit